MDETPPVEVVKRKRGRPRKVQPVAAQDPMETRIADLEQRVQGISDGVVDNAAKPSSDDERKAYLAWLDEPVTWTMPATDTGDPVRIINQVRSWEFWPKNVYRTPRGVMNTALAQAGVNQHIEAMKLKDRGQDVNLGNISL